MAQSAPARRKAKAPAEAAAAVKAPPPKKPAAKKAAAPAPAAPPAKPKAPAAEKAGKAGEPRKPKLVRDSFTIPKTEYAVLDSLKQRAAKAGLPSKKSEVLRAGIMALAAFDDAAFRAALGGVPTLKTGRPKKD